MKIKSINPATGKVLGEADCATKQDVIRAVKRARAAFSEWSKTDIPDREKLLKKVASLLKRREREIAESITREMGKPIRESLSSVESGAEILDYYSEKSRIFLEEEVVAEGSGSRDIVRCEPVGVVGAINPWNYPIWTPCASFAGALMAGNTVVFKPSELVPLTSIKFAKLFQEAGFPDGVLETVVGGKETGKYLVASDIDIVTLTGSVETGRRAASEAGKGLKRIVLELGGSDPYVVCGGADIERAASKGVGKRFGNCGQVCTAAKRFIIVEELYDDFVRKFVEKTKRLKVGDPMDESTDVGPMVSHGQREKLHAQVKDAVDKGARVLCGGRKIKGPGFFYEPTVLVGVNQKMRVLTEETFGPVAPIVRARDTEEAISIANDTKFGLGASVWAKDAEEGLEIAKRIQSGEVSVNGASSSSLDCPFGGVKHSGIGRELSKYGVLEFVNLKCVSVKL